MCVRVCVYACVRECVWWKLNLRTVNFMYWLEAFVFILFDDGKEKRLLGLDMRMVKVSYIVWMWQQGKCERK